MVSATGRAARAAAAMERHQVGLCLAAMVVGLCLGAAVPASAPGFATALDPVLVALLTSTFLGVPLVRLRRALADRRFLVAVVVLNAILVPTLARLVTLPLRVDSEVLLGAVLVLVCPCVDWVVVFTGLSRGDAARLLAATPLLMAVQILLLPLWLSWFVGVDATSDLTVVPFVRAFVLFIVCPLLLAVLLQRLEAGHAPTAGVLHRCLSGLMVPLLVATIVCVAASQAHAVTTHLPRLARAAAVFALFLVLAPCLGAAVGRLTGQDAHARRALALAATARNSLVVLPLALAAAGSAALVPVVVVAQSLVELVGLSLLVRVLPALVRDRRPDGPLSP